MAGKYPQGGKVETKEKSGTAFIVQLPNT